MQKENDFIRKQSKKGVVVDEMPGAPGEEPIKLLTSIDKLKKKGDIDKTVKKLNAFIDNLNNLMSQSNDKSTQS